MRRLALHWQIIIGLSLGLVYGITATNFGWGNFTSDWVAPFGTIFINLLKLIAMPLVLSSLITGVASLSDVKKLSRIGGKTIAIYIGTTTIAVALGLVTVNMLRPGDKVPDSMKEKLQLTYEEHQKKQVQCKKSRIADHSNQWSISFQAISSFQHPVIEICYR